MREDVGVDLRVCPWFGNVWNHNGTGRHAGLPLRFRGSPHRADTQVCPYDSGVKPSTMSKRAASSPTRDFLIGAKSTMMDSRTLGSRTLLRIESRSLPGSPLT